MAYTKTVSKVVAAAGVHTLTLSDVDNLYVGDSVTVAGCGNDFNGTHTLTAIDTTNLTVTFTQGNHTQASTTVYGQVDVNVVWIADTDVSTWLGFDATSTYLDEVTAAANEWAYRKRKEAGYADRTAFPPNPAAKEGTVLYAATLYRERGTSGDQYAAYDGMGQFDRPVSMARIVQLLGVSRPQVG